MSEFLKRLSDGLGPLFRTWSVVARDAGSHRQGSAVLPENEKEHVISATYDEETLVIVTNSAAWASRIRYGQERMLAALRDQGETKGTKMRVSVGARSA